VPATGSTAAQAGALTALQLRAQQATALVSRFNAALHDELAARLQQRSRAALLTLGSLGLIALLLCTLLVYGSVCLYLNFTRALTTLGRNLAAVARGDLTDHRELPGSDELALIGREIARMSRQLSAMVADIRSNAGHVALAGDSLASGNTALAQRTSAQTRGLEHTSASVREISHTVEQTAMAAREVTERAEQLRRVADAGSTTMRAAVAAMDAIAAGSRRMVEVVALIEVVAFQTNMLALNASVEAARADMAGRGFAVVAEKISVIAVASSQQSVGLSEVSAAIGDLDAIARENTLMVKDSRNATADLLARAGSLSKAVNGIRLWQGSTDEAHALVDRAADLVASVGLAAAAAQIHDPQGAFIDRDLYVFGIDRRGRYRLMGADPARVGQAVPLIASADGSLLADALWAKADGGGGWVNYQLCDPETLGLVDKTSYARAVNDELLIGCGQACLHPGQRRQCPPSRAGGAAGLQRGAGTLGRRTGPDRLIPPVVAAMAARHTQGRGVAPTLGQRRPLSARCARRQHGGSHLDVTALGAQTQGMVDQHQGQQAFGDGRGANADAGVVAPVRDDQRGLAVQVDRAALDPDRAGGLDGDAYRQILASRDAAQHTAGMVAGKAFRQQFVAVFAALLAHHVETVADLHALDRVDAHHGVGDSGIELVVQGLTQANRHAARLDVQTCTDRIA
jgi:methyl-accepting chemotaxis protein